MSLVSMIKNISHDGKLRWLRIIDKWNEQWIWFMKEDKNS